MPIPPMPDVSATEAIAGGAISTALAWWAWLRARADKRTDKAGVITEEIYAKLLKQQQEEIARRDARIESLERRVAELESARINWNIEMRAAKDAQYAAERRAMHYEADVTTARLVNEDLQKENNELRSKLAAGKVGSHST